MSEIKVMLIVPGAVSNRLSEDLDIPYTVRREALPEYQVYIDALKDFKFYFFYYTSVPREEMLSCAEQVWSDISYAVYLDPKTQEGDFYHDSRPVRSLRAGNVGVEDFVEELGMRGMPCIPIQMDFNDDIHEAGEISIRHNYMKCIEYITSRPEIIYRSAYASFPLEDSWVLKAEKALDKCIVGTNRRNQPAASEKMDKLLFSLFDSRGMDVTMGPSLNKKEGSLFLCEKSRVG